MTTLVARHPAATTVGSLAALSLGLHLAVDRTTAYGVHRDEFLYEAAGRHLRLWTSDFPPAIAVLTAAQHAVLGDSLLALRVASGVAGALLIVLAALMARALGGRTPAQCLAAFAVLANPLFLRTAHLLQPVVFDQLCWTAALYILVLLCQSATRARWLALGVALGVGLLWKFTILVLVGAIAVSVIGTPPRRRWLATPGPWLALLVIPIVGAPSIVGQLRLGGPVFGQIAELNQGQLVHLGFAQWFADVAVLGPTVILAILGAIWLVRDRLYRVVGVSCLIAFATIFLLHGKPYYAAPVYPTLFAAGAIALDRFTVWAAVAIGAYGAIALPLALPILPPQPMVRYTTALGMTTPLHTDQGGQLPLPQDFADMLGWPQLADAVAAVFDSLPDAAIMAQNYGEAGALDFYGPQHGLPPAINTQGTYYLFGPGTRSGATLIAVGVDSAWLARHYDSVRLAARTNNPLGVEEERAVPIYVCRAPHQSLQALWPDLSGRY
jgi:hypothetical protein